MSPRRPIPRPCPLLAALAARFDALVQKYPVQPLRSRPHAALRTGRGRLPLRRRHRRDCRSASASPSSKCATSPPTTPCCASSRPANTTSRSAPTSVACCAAPTNSTSASRKSSASATRASLPTVSSRLKRSSASAPAAGRRPSRSTTTSTTSSSRNSFPASSTAIGSGRKHRAEGTPDNDA